MKVALIVPGGVDRSGERHVVPAVLWLVERLARHHDVHVFARDQEPAPGEWALLGATVHNIGMTAGRRRRMYATFGAEHQRAPFEVVHGMFGWGGIWASLLGARHRLPALFHAAGGELVALDDIAYGMRTTARGRVACRMALRGASRVTVASTYMQQLAAALHVHADVVPLGVALDRWPARAPRRRTPGEPLRLLQVADIRPVKDQGLLLRAMCELEARAVPVELDVCGLDTEGGARQSSADARALGARLRWHGHVNRDILRGMMERADVLAITSRHEAGPVAVLEAAVAGVPTVGTCVGHIADWAPQAAIAVPVGDAPALAAAIAGIAADEDRRLALAGDAQRRALAIDADFTAAEFQRIYAELSPP